MPDITHPLLGPQVGGGEEGYAHAPPELALEAGCGWGQTGEYEGEFIYLSSSSPADAAFPSSSPILTRTASLTLFSAS